MNLEPSKHGGTVLIPSADWARFQVELDEAVELCIDMVAQIANHRINGKYDAEDLLEMIEGQTREIRRLIERLVTPF